MAEYVTKIRTEDGDKQIDYNALANLPKLPTIESIGAASANHTHTPESIGAANVKHTHTCSDISNFPTSLPANGGNADTVDGKHADDFALAADVKNISLSSFGVTATATELNYVDGVTSNIQTQLNNKAASGHTHGYAESNHTHDDRYYTESEVNTLLANKANTFASGNTVLSSYQYGNELPSPGIVGRLYLKKVSS